MPVSATIIVFWILIAIVAASLKAQSFTCGKGSMLFTQFQNDTASTNPFTNKRTFTHLTGIIPVALIMHLSRLLLLVIFIPSATITTACLGLQALSRMRLDTVFIKGFLLSMNLVMVKPANRSFANKRGRFVKL
jgi:hypothetical protein